MHDRQNPASALVGFEAAVNAGQIQPRASGLFADLVIYFDEAEGTPRRTYALRQGQAIRAVAVYFLEKNVAGYPCFDLGYAVAEAHRNQGLAHLIVEQSLAQLRHEIRGQIEVFFVEAIVPSDNPASQKVAARALTEFSREIIDAESGASSVQYLQRFLP